MQLDGFDSLYMDTHQFFGQRERNGKLHRGCQYRDSADGHDNGRRTDLYRESGGPGLHIFDQSDELIAERVERKL